MKKRKELISLGTNIKKIRGDLGISQEQLALLSGIDRTYIGGVERGERNIGLINLVRIAKALKVPCSRLVKDVDN